MRTILFLILFVCSANLVSAQQSLNFNCCNNKIDSLIQLYSTNKMNIEGYKINLYFIKQCNKDLTINEKYKLLDKTKKLFEQKKYFDLYVFSSELLNRCRIDFEEPEIKQYITEVLLEKYFYFPFSGISLFDNTNQLNRKSTARLKTIMKNKRSPREVEILYWYYKTQRSDSDLSNVYTIDAKKILRKTKRFGSKTEKAVKDSLISSDIEKSVQAELARPPLYGRKLYILGDLGDTTFIPLIETLMKKYPDTYKYTGTYALAKLGVRKYTDDVLSNDTDINYLYLGTEEAFWRFMELNFVWNKTQKFTSDGQDFPKAFTTIFFMMDYVANIPKELRLKLVDVENYESPFKEKPLHDYDPLKDEKNKVIIQKIYKAYQWLVDNKGLLIFNK